MAKLIPFLVSDCVSGLTAWPIQRARQVLQASRAYRKCVLQNKQMKVPQAKKLLPNENGQITVKFVLLMKYKDLEMLENYTSCKKHTKRRALLTCIALNLKFYLKKIESEHEYKFVFN